MPPSLSAYSPSPPPSPAATGTPAAGSGVTALARERLDSLAKPPGSLGALERLACRLAATQNRLDPAARPCRHLVFAGDHGVVAEGTSPWSSTITAAMLPLFLQGKACGAAIARRFGVETFVIDVGSATPAPPAHAAFRDWRIGRGTRNLAHEAAMTREEFLAAWHAGERAAVEAHQAGMRVIALGEMGIGNTTPAACLTALLTGHSAAAVTGPGAGLAQPESLARKVAIVEKAAAKARERFDADPVAAIASVAGFEIAALAGCIAAATRLCLTAVLDGFIVTAAALTAETLAPGALASAIAAHVGAEPGHRLALERLGLEPFLDWQLRLGEGSGALLLLPLLDAAAALLTDAAVLSSVLQETAST